MAGRAGRRRVRSRDRLVFSPRRLDGGLWLLPQAHDAPGSHFVSRPWLHKPGVRFHHPSRRDATDRGAPRVTILHRRLDHDAVVLLPDRLAKTVQAPFRDPGHLRLSRRCRRAGGVAVPMKLGMIAMSGVRAHNKELTKLGLTLPGFVERNKVIASLPSLGLLTLAGMTPDDFDLRYLEVPDISAVSDLPGDFDVVAISSFSAQIGEAYEL